jgi:hypothetical protein
MAGSAPELGAPLSPLVRPELEFLGRRSIRASWSSICRPGASSSWHLISFSPPPPAGKRSREVGAGPPLLPPPPLEQGDMAPVSVAGRSPLPARRQQWRAFPRRRPMRARRDEEDLGETIEETNRWVPYVISQVGGVELGLLLELRLKSRAPKSWGSPYL